MKNKLLLASLSIIVSTSLCACTINITPELVLEPDPIKVTSSQGTDTEVTGEEDPDVDGEEDPDINGNEDPEVNNEGDSQTDNSEFSIPDEWGKKMDNAVYAGGIKDENVHDEITLYYLAGNLYYESVSYYDEDIMSWYAAEVNVTSEPQINGDEISFSANVLRFSSFSYAGEYWDDGVESEIVFSKDSLTIQLPDEYNSFSGKCKTPDSLFHDTEYMHRLLEECYGDIFENDYMELYGEWCYKEDGLFKYVRINKDDTMVFLTKEEGRPVSITFSSFSKFFNGDSFLFVMIGQLFGYTEVSEPVEFWMEVVSTDDLQPCLRMTLYPDYGDVIVNEYYQYPYYYSK